MARVDYDPHSIQGALLKEAVNALIRGQGQLERVYKAADVASNAGTDTTALEGGAFGAAAGQGDDMWQMIASIRGLLENANQGGLMTFLSSLDAGTT